MARISTYIFDQNVTKKDFVIGSDAQTNYTRNYRLEDLAKFFGKQQSSLGDKFAYVYDQLSVYSDLTKAEASLSNKTQVNSLFSSVDSIFLSKFNDQGDDVTSFFQSIQENGVLRVHNGFRTTDYGVYRVQDVIDTGNDVLEIVVDLLQGNGSITDQETLVFSASFTLTDKTYSTPEMYGDVWQIQHNLGKFPSVSIVDTSGNMIYAEIQYNDLNNITITFASSVAGKAHIN